MTFNPAGSLLAVGTATDVYLRASDTGEESARIPHPDTVNDVSFSADGNILVTASSRILQFWDISKVDPIRQENLIENACSRLVENFSEAQWKVFFENEPYRVLCPNLPVP